MSLGSVGSAAAARQMLHPRHRKAIRVATSYRKVVWIVVFGLLLAMAEYGLAVQSARPQRGSVEPDGSEGPDHESREHRMNSRDSNEALGYRE